MRRRRQKNPLLMRIIIASVVVHIIALPILAHFGALKKIQSHFVETKMVVLAPPPPVKQDPPKTVQRKAVSAPVKSRRGSGASRGSANHLHVAVQRSNNVSGSGDGGSSIEQGSRPPGSPVGDGNGGKPDGPKKADPAPPPVIPKDPVKPMPPPVVPKQPVMPMPKPVEQTPQPMPQPHVPVFTEATAIDGKQVQPEIPDALRGDPLDATAVVEVTVGPDGVPTDASVSQSAGKKELDKLALDAAKQWRFKPAMRDGEAIASKVRLHFEFQVN